MRLFIALVLAAQALWPATVLAQSPLPPGPTTGNPNNPGDPNNPHPTMPWFGPATPYGQFIRWVWVPPKAVLTNERVELYEPGYWVKETTAGYYYPVRWVLQETTPGNFGWVLLNHGAVPFAR
jgi:hypothetical protein